MAGTMMVLPPCCQISHFLRHVDSVRKLPALVLSQVVLVSLPGPVKSLHRCDLWSVRRALHASHILTRLQLIVSEIRSCRRFQFWYIHGKDFGMAGVGTTTSSLPRPGRLLHPPYQPGGHQSQGNILVGCPSGLRIGIPEWGHSWIGQVVHPCSIATRLFYLQKFGRPEKDSGLLGTGLNNRKITKNDGGTSSDISESEGDPGKPQARPSRVSHGNRYSWFAHLNLSFSSINIQIATDY